MTGVTEIWDKFYDYAKRGAPQNFKWGGEQLDQHQSITLALINFASTHHRDKVNDIKAELDKFIVSSVADKDPEVKKLLSNISNICLRTE